MISPERSARLDGESGQLLRETRLWRALARSTALSRFWIYRELRRLGIDRRSCLRRGLQMTYPTVALAMLRRNDIIRARYLAETHR